MKKYRYITVSILIIGIIIYNILAQKNIIKYDETIYSMIYIYITTFIIWISIEAYIFNQNNVNLKKQNKMVKKIKNSISDEHKYKTLFGDDVTSKIAEGLSSKKRKKEFCINCHREIYSSNYTGINLCSECKNHYYKK